MQQLDIKDDILVRCTTDEKNVTIPGNVNYVYENAFETCPGVNVINLHPDYIEKELANYLTRLLVDVVKVWDRENYSPCFPIYFIDEELIDKALEKAENKVKQKYPDRPVQLVTFTGEQLAKMCQARKNGYDIASLYNLPLACREDNGYGILYVKGITKEILNLLDPKFDNNLFREHSLLGYNLSDKWLVVLSAETRFDSSDSVSAFSKQNCWMRSPKEYLKYMDGLNRVIHSTD